MRRSLGGTRVAPPQATLKRSPPAQKKKPAARKRDMPLAETDDQGWIQARRGASTTKPKPAARKPAAKPVARRAPPHPPSSSSESDAPPPRKPAARRRRPPEDFTKDLAGSDGSVSEPEEAPESDGGLDDARGKKKADASTYRFDDDDDDDDDDALDPKRPPRRRIATQESDTQDSVLESKQPARRSGSAVACRSDASDDDRPGPESQDSVLSTTTKKKPRSASTTGNDAAIARALASPAGATPDSDDDDFLYASSPGPRRPATKPSKRRPRSDTEEEEAAEVLPEKRPRGAPRERTPTQPSPKPRARRSSQDSDGSVSQKAAPRRRPPRKKRRSAAPKATQDIDIDDFVDSHTPRQSQDDPSDGEDGDSAAWRDAPTAVASVRRWRVRSSGLVWAATGDDYYGDGRRGGFHKRPAYALPHREVASLRLPPPLKNHAYVRVFDDAAFPPWDAPRLVPRSSLLGFRGDASAPRWDPPRVKAMKSKLRAAEFRHVFERGAAAALALALAFDEESDSDEGVQEARPPEESQGDAHQDAVREFLYERRPARLPRLEYEALVDLCVDPHMYGARLARDAYEPASSEVRAAVRAAIEGCALDAAVLDRGRRALDAVEDGSILEFIR